MADPKIFMIRSSIFSRSKPLVIGDHFVELPGRSPALRFGLEDFDALRLGGNGHRISFFTLSRNWAMDLRGSNGKLIRIRYYSLFGIGSAKKNALFQELLTALNTTFLNRLCFHYFSLLENDLAFELGGALLSADGVKLTRKSGIVPWHRLGLKEYGDQFILFDARAEKVYCSFDFYHTWNAVLLFYIASHLIPEKRNSGQTATGPQY